MHLVVTVPFGDHSKGDQITELDHIAAVLESHPTHVVRVASAVPEANPTSVVGDAATDYRPIPLTP